jgi:hypothetical protein
MGLRRNRGGETKSQHPKYHLGQGKGRNETTYRIRQHFLQNWFLSRDIENIKEQKNNNNENQQHTENENEKENKITTLSLVKQLKK